MLQKRNPGLAGLLRESVTFQRRALDANGDVVGTSQDASGMYRAFLWRRGAMIEVKARIESGHEPLDVADIVGGRRPSYAPAPTPAPAPAPMPSAMRQQPPPSYNPPVAAAAPPPAVYAPAPAPAPIAAPPPPSYNPVPPPANIHAGDWEAIVTDLQQITEDQLGNRARKVKDLLGAAERSRPGIQSAIDQIPTISILFVDASRLEALASDLRSRLDAYPG